MGGIGPILLVAAGGAMGSSLRYLLSLWLQPRAPAVSPPGLPWGTLAANALGAAAIGVLAGLGPLLPAPWRLFAITGILGGLTTFSALVFETFTLGRAGEGRTALLYLVGSVAGGLLLVALGYLLGQGLAGQIASPRR